MSRLKQALAAALLLMCTGCLGISEPSRTLVSLEVERWYPSDVVFPKPDQDPVLRAIRSELGIDLKLTFTTGRSNDWRSKMGSRIASGDYPDLVYFFNMMDYRSARSEGWLAPLNDIVNERNYPEHLGYLTGSLLQHISDDNGVYYAIPNRPPMLVEGMFIRKDWLDKLDLPVPRTTEQFAETAIAFAVRDPDGNGKNDTYGFTSGGGGCMSCQDFWELTSAFLGAPGMDENVAPDGSVRGGWTSPEYRSYLIYMRGLMEKGALDPDLVTNDWNRKEQKIKQGQVGIFHSTGYPKELIAELKKNDPQAEVIYMEPIFGPAGKGTHGAKIVNSTAIGISVKAARNPVKLAKALELIDWMNGPGWEKLLTEGHNREMADFLNVYNITGENLIRTPDMLQKLYPDAGDAEIVRKMLVHTGNAGTVYGLGIAAERPLPIDNLKKYREQMAAMFIYGKAGLDDEGWAEYVKTHDTTYNGQAVREALMQDLQKHRSSINPKNG